MRKGYFKVYFGGLENPCYTRALDEEEARALVMKEIKRLSPDIQIDKVVSITKEEFDKI